MKDSTGPIRFPVHCWFPPIDFMSPGETCIWVLEILTIFPFHESWTRLATVVESWKSLATMCGVSLEKDLQPPMSLEQDLIRPGVLFKTPNSSVEATAMVSRFRNHWAPCYGYGFGIRGSLRPVLHLSMISRFRNHWTPCISYSSEAKLHWAPYYSCSMWLSAFVLENIAAVRSSVISWGSMPYYSMGFSNAQGGWESFKFLVTQFDLSRTDYIGMVYWISIPMLSKLYVNLHPSNVIWSALDSSMSKLNLIRDGINTLCVRFSGLIIVAVLMPDLKLVLTVRSIIIPSLSLNMILDSTLALLWIEKL